MPDPAPTIARPLSRFLTASLARELGIVLTLSVMFPFLTHVLPVPETSRMGARLLPMFYAPLLAVLWGRMPTAWLAASLSPWLNWALTSHPAPPGAVVMMIELLIFVVLLRRLLARAGARWFMAVPAYLTGMIAATIVTALFPALIGGRPALDWAVQSVTTGLPGVAIMVLFTCLALAYYPPAGGDGGPAAA